MPAMQRGQTIGTHDPDKFTVTAFLPQQPQGISGISALHLLFDIGHDKTRMPGNAFGVFQPFSIFASFTGVFEGILRRNQPPDPIQLQMFQGIKRHHQMTTMGGIEAAAEKPNALATSTRWQS